ncbi:archaetidylserine decarboxylase [Phaeobacter gallaeciensis]|uniref:archaetidylserine decarboxylase n=1 Tax=Phaeobacter gallaeciensis TaxID=60890 RepID=UPI00237F2313|nr:archaetidylserine decarboxylase [Phaeobacter gallaeciensis]MDE4302744.1 archaetidylserine decarboxylase [Phaeobacter gallaeciensis]MDE4307163.1 archaetidylserine decarboxylase [Phaeobacter gallaeciensis]MDE4311628.1 archaetidylserine decarboxylase [Phaeobacter gallaeciensis]MDE4316065.1 archaetidylserine decarboxylase [Phaeobacter gallaeciensis]MDE4320555.1 archaetidylserine decarboxylase [Phaeobacter gallaeciensis]
MTNTPIKVVDRASGTVFDEVILGEKWIRWAYQDAGSNLLERALFRSSLVSRLFGLWFDSPLSRRKIAAVIEELSIDMDEARDPVSSFRCFNDFFVRHLKPETRPYSDELNDIVSPADGRVLVFPELEEDVFVPVKGHPMSIRTMLPGLHERFLGGALAIVRLCPADYHRYHFPTAGQITETRDIPGALHSVNPIALGAGPDVFGDNKRSLTLIETDTAGTMCFVEVGAFGVGSIVNTRTSGRVEKMDEKGYFKFGGSTVVVVFEPGKVQFSDDLITNSSKGLETLVKVGEPLARAL